MPFDPVSYAMGASSSGGGGGGGGGLIVVHSVDGVMDMKAGELYAAAQTSPVLVDYQGLFCLLNSFSLESGPWYNFGFFAGDNYTVFFSEDADAYPIQS